MSDHDSDSAKMDSDDESTRLHIHDCDVRDDAEEVSTIYAGEIHTRLAEETILTSAPRVSTQDHVANKHQQPDRYVKHNDDLEWAADNTVPDVLAMTELESMDAKIWIPIFTGKNFKGFIEKFEDLREVLGWDEMTSRAYLLRSLRLTDPDAPLHITRWKYDAIVIYLTEQYTPLRERLDAITQVMQTQRQPRESLNDLAIRISRELNKVPLDRKRKAALASAAFRHALRMEPRLVEHIEKSLYTVPRFFQQVDLARKFEREHGPEQATVVTDGGHDLAVLNVRGTPLPPALQTSKVKNERTDSDATPRTVRVQPITSRGARRPHPKTRKAAKTMLRLQTPVAYVDRVYPRWGGTMHIVLEIAGLTDPVHMLVDTGAAVSILPEPQYERLDESQRKLTTSDLDIRASNGTPIVCLGKAALQFKIRHYHKCFTHEFYICNENTTPLLGMDFMSEHNTLVHLRLDKFAIDGVICTTYDETGRLVRQGMTQASTSESTSQ